jgi:hypothetical protein
MNRIQQLCSSLLLLSVVAHADPGKSPAITAKMTLPYDTVLPGVPFEMRVTLKNVSTANASVGVTAQLVVTLPDGGRFAPRDSQILEPRLSWNADSSNTWAELAPGESRELAIRVSWPPNWAQYGVYTGPGIYGIALRLEGQEAPDNYVGPLLTNSARLQRVLPVGEDLALWQRMLAAAGGRWSDSGFMSLKEGVALAQEIIDIHPASQYYPYALILRMRYALPDEIERSREAAERFPDSPVHSDLLMHAASCALSEAITASFWNHDHVKGEKYYALAQRYLDDVLKSTSSPVLLDEARRGVRDIQREAERKVQKE